MGMLKSDKLLRDLIHVILNRMNDYHHIFNHLLGENSCEKFLFIFEVFSDTFNSSAKLNDFHLSCLKILIKKPP